MKTLAALIAKRDALNAKIAEIQNANKVGKITVGTKVTLKAVEGFPTREDNYGGMGNGYLVFRVTKVMGDRITVKGWYGQKTVNVERVRTVKA